MVFWRRRTKFVFRFFFSRPIETVAEWCIPGGKRDESFIGYIIIIRVEIVDRINVIYILRDLQVVFFIVRCMKKILNIKKKVRKIYSIMR